MSDDRHLANWQPAPRDLGRLCPECGRPLRDRDTSCPACGATGCEKPAGLLTPFGYGVCAAAGVGLLAVAIALGVAGAGYAPGAGVAPVAAGGVAAVAAAQIGSRLAPRWRCSYEHLLLGVMVAGPVALTASLFGLSNPESLIGLWAIVIAAVYGTMRRYGYRAA